MGEGSFRSDGGGVRGGKDGGGVHGGIGEGGQR
jgi:hypothetical protein